MIVNLCTSLMEGKSYEHSTPKPTITDQGTVNNFRTTSEPASCENKRYVIVILITHYKKNKTNSLGHASLSSHVVQGDEGGQMSAWQSNG